MRHGFCGHRVHKRGTCSHWQWLPLDKFCAVVGSHATCATISAGIRYVYQTTERYMLTMAVAASHPRYVTTFTWSFGICMASAGTNFCQPNTMWIQKTAM